MKGPLVLAIDPGLHKMGLAYFNARSHKLLKTELIESSGNLDHALARVQSKLKTHEGIMTVVIEEPQQFMSSKKGTAASNSGSVMKLLALVYSIRQMSKMMARKVILAPVVKWKGQVPKEVMARRLAKYYDLSGKNPDEIDAIGIGRWYFEEYDDDGDN